MSTQFIASFDSLGHLQRNRRDDQHRGQERGRQDQLQRVQGHDGRLPTHHHKQPRRREEVETPLSDAKIVENKRKICGHRHSLHFSFLNLVVICFPN